MRRGGVAGLALTFAMHGALVYLVYHSQRVRPPRPEIIRDVMVTKLVTLGKERKKNLLPRLPTTPPPPEAPPPEIKIAPTPEAPPAPPPEPEPPKPKKEPEISDLQKALRRAQMLSRAAEEEPPEGSPTGSPFGTSSEASEGDAYATAVMQAIQQNWSAPAGLLGDAEMAHLQAGVRVSISPDGSLGEPVLREPSGNPLFDDSCMRAVRATGSVPPPPPAQVRQARRGYLLQFEGKDL